MAQFNCPELGGSGQWMRGGMIMVGDMFNNNLKSTVDNLCNELSNALANMQFFPPARQGSYNNWWPAELGSPSSSGGQNNIQYAVFPSSSRLAINNGGQVTIYNTLDHNIGGVSQQQGGADSLTFSSQYGTIAVSSLPIVSGPGVGQSANTNFLNDPQPAPKKSNNALSEETLNLLEKLGQLRDAGVLSNEEFQAKKNDLLNRL